MKKEKVINAILSPAVDDKARDETGIDRLTVRKNSLGSEYVAFHADRGTVMELARLRLEDAFRRVVLDPVRGLVMLMSPSAAHETISGHLDTLVEVIADEQKLANIKLEATRWRLPSGPENTGYEADCCFYLGENAIAYIDATSQGKTTLEAYLLVHPPDLVVEVAVTHISKNKQLGYRDLGVPEFWQIDCQSELPMQNLAVTFLDLQVSAGPQSLSESMTLPGLRPEHVSTAVEKLSDKDINTWSKRRAAIVNIIQKNRA